ncbi:PepSY-associated TM helix domain-containing protein [Alkalitalea saponilacus]|uniref:PepSY-associated TM region n=1 Tax=Alkalitalea saponilacus TaxID=889453 RepID=A0A1T5HAB4_9BACT|nr:PepSY-associated TM helix domain-containing protein [Alkalitalea saponilacus]ASB50802.1 hypothetical protein CDL62_17400 [Alkalitalea saponilacus]SKC17584.1 hypothetical protein SAMN03080601_02178 [Alkalitalea saponilacus]
MQINWRKINRVIHRDLGYFFFGMVIIYGLSGIAMNHRNDWNPNYIITHVESPLMADSTLLTGTDEAFRNYLKEQNIRQQYKSHFSPAPNQIRIFLEGESTLTLNFQRETQVYESIRKRPVFYQVNLLHYNPGTWWKWFSDIFAVSLILIAITGLFILKGKNGITRRGAWLTIAGILLPVLFLLFYS